MRVVIFATVVERPMPGASVNSELEAVARAAVSDNHHNDKLPEVYQHTCELKEIDNELFDVVMLMRLYHY